VRKTPERSWKSGDSSGRVVEGPGEVTVPARAGYVKVVSEPEV
jgi:hypothetical protein